MAGRGFTGRRTDLKKYSGIIYSGFLINSNNFNMMEKFFSTLRGMVAPKKTELKEAETLEAPTLDAPTLQTEKTKQFNALPDLTDQVEELHESDSSHSLETLNSEDVVPEMPENVDQEAPTFKTDKTIELEQEVLAAKAPTFKTEATMELQAEKAVTFKTGETIVRDEAVAAERMPTLRDLNKGYMEYDQIHSRVTEWLERVDGMLAKPGALEELKSLKQLIEGVKDKVEGQLDVEQYGIAKSEAGAAPFKIEVPEEWPEVEARLNEIAEASKAGGTIREPMVKEEPTIRQAA